MNSPAPNNPHATASAPHAPAATRPAHPRSNITPAPTATPRCIPAFNHRLPPLPHVPARNSSVC